MRSIGAWLTRLKTRWLELTLLIGFVGLLVWFGCAAAPAVRSLQSTPTPIPSPIPALSPTPEARKFDGQVAFQHVPGANGHRPPSDGFGCRT